SRLNRLFKKALSDDAKLEKIYRDIEMPLSEVLFKMEQNGVLIDTKLLDQQTVQLNAQAQKLEEQAFEAAGEKFKLSSPKQLGEILFDKMGVVLDGAKPKKTVSGNYSTSEEVLSELAQNYPLAKIALEYRTITKLVTTYTEKLPKMVDPKDGRVHTTFEQAVAVTGRLSSTNPNLQNIPIRTEEGRKVREAFIAASGCKLISADYSQIELRIMAHLSADKRLVEAFKNNEDIHRATAAEVFGKERDKVTPNDRRIAKVINFGLMYGMSPFGLAKNLGIGRDEAKN
ncbi:DNA polymerase, partial [Parasutterella excrementihominis]